MLFWDAHAGRAFPGVPLASARPPGGWRCAPAGVTGRAEPAAPRGQGLGAQLPRFGGARAGAGGRGRADGARGGAAVWRS